MLQVHIQYNYHFFPQEIVSQKYKFCHLLLIYRTIICSHSIQVWNDIKFSK